MQRINVPSWDDFEQQLRTLSELHGVPINYGDTHLSPYLYRGQADSGWRLKTTLERSEFGNLSLSAYYRLICTAKPQIESATGREWDVLNVDKYCAWLDRCLHPFVATPPGYEYMAYLRHHGFPSPLLDWTRSPYVAVYFAFRYVPPDADSVAVFVYREYLGHGKSWESDKPHVHGLGPDIRTHQRHFLQQSEYTVCTVRDTDWRYAYHEDAFASGAPGQDALWQICIPSTERPRVLRHLDRMNINAYSLFGTEDTLIETLAFRESPSGRFPRAGKPLD